MIVMIIPYIALITLTSIFGRNLDPATAGVLLSSSFVAWGAIGRWVPCSAREREGGIEGAEGDNRSNAAIDRYSEVGVEEYLQPCQ